MILKKRVIRNLTSVLLVMSFVLASVIPATAEKASDTETVPVSAETVDIKSKYEDTYVKYLSQYQESEVSTEDIIYNANNVTLSEEVIEFEIESKQSGFYSFGMSYKALDSSMAAIRVGLKIDGNYPYTKAEKFEFPRMWKDDPNGKKYDASGNEFAAQQIEYNETYCYSEAIDETVTSGDTYLIYLSEGKHNISISPVDGKISLEYVKFASTAVPEKYSAPAKDAKYYDGETIILEAEKSKIKSSHFFVGKADNASTMVTPQSAESSLINYIGAGNWKTVGETIIWETPELKAGYYNIGFSFRQNSVIGGSSYRTLMIDGEVPFAEAKNLGFGYGDNWQQKIYSDDSGNPYAIYLSEGKHQIALKVTSGEIGPVRKLLTDAVGDMGDLYVDITKITGETVDIYRDYDLFRQIGDMEERLNKIKATLQDAGKLLLEITGETTGSNYSVITNMIEVINQMLDNKFEAHRYKSYYYTNYCSVSSVLQELRSMPLDLDKIILTSNNAEEPFEKVGFFEKTWFGIERFIVSFTKNYDSVSAASEDAKESITIWITWGRDQAQVLSALVDRSFTPQTGISVNLKLVNASIIQAVLSGKGPDCRLQQARSEPVNLAMRGVLYDLSKFDDCDEVLKNFQEGAETPYVYRDGLYALPDTQGFYVMFYRKDILEEYGIEVPQTWEEFDLAAKLLTRNNMTVCFPNAVVTDAVSSGGVGASTIFPTLLLQNGVDIYSEDGHKTNLLTSDAMTVFEKWTNYYTKLKFPISMDFYNRLRTGTNPLGVSTYTMYTTLKAAAPEIEGLWSFAPLPGVRQEDGSIDHTSAGSGTGCSILEMSKSPEAAWEFLKWWVEADTQTSFSNDVESILGPTGRVSLANVEGLKGLTWDDGDIDILMEAWNQVEEIPEYPGSYYVARSIYQAYWNVVSDNKNTKDMLMKFGQEADDEIARKWEQYTNRGK